VLREAKLISLRDGIIEHFLPGGIPLNPNQEDDDDEVELEDRETLEFLQGM
jgi:hypothetical protein